ncbi:MAG: S41 family peptidase [Pseudomonadota bacterium]
MSRLVFLFCALVLSASSAKGNEPVGDPHEFSATPEITPQSIENLFLLGKVWGYLKYHHPNVIAGCFKWDEKLFGVVDETVAASSREEASEVLVDWLKRIDGPQDGCGTASTGAEHYSVDDNWLTDNSLLSPELATAIAPRTGPREQVNSQHYVSLAEGVRNPVFKFEDGYSDVEHLDWRYRMLALFRFWNIIEYWSPYRNLIGADWDGVLRDSIPRFVRAEDDDQYALELMALIARIRDSHSNLWSAFDQRPPAGTLDVPAHIRPVEGLPVVWRTYESEVSDSGEAIGPDGLRYGDIILTVDGTPTGELVKNWTPYLGVSNEATLLREAYRYLLRGAEKSVEVQIDRDGRQMDLTLERVPQDLGRPWTHDRDGDALQLLSDGIAYLKLSAISKQQIPTYLETIDGARGLIIDIRNYPAEFVVFALGQHLVEKATPFVRFTHGDLESPGTFRWTEPLELKPASPFFGGKVVILVDETSQSQAEYTAMAFRAAPDAVVIGSQTAGADGNMSPISLPGNHRTFISGIGVFYPDKTPTQQIGIVPDISIKPTVRGIRNARDEVLEAAVMQIVGKTPPEEALRRLTRIPHAPQKP